MRNSSGRAWPAALLLCAACVLPCAAAEIALAPEIETFVGEMVEKHEFRRAELRRLFAQAQMRPSIVRAISAPRTAAPWHEFRAAYINAARIDGGVAFWRRHASWIGRASREYGVPEEVIVATIGVETLYGRNVGSFRVLDALTTLAFGYPPRAEYFRSELEEFLLLARETGRAALTFKGSYAGAIGIPQFLPSSYRKYAIDFDADGRRDLAAPADAIGSVANYYRAFGWRPGETAAVPAETSGTALDAALTGDIKPQIPVGELRRRGIVPLAAVDDEALAALFAVETENGPRYWLGLNNFYVITRYNRSVNYALVVLELAGEVRAAKLRAEPSSDAVR